MTDEFKLEPFEPHKYEELKIFCLGDDFHWWIGYDLESCLKDAEETYSIERSSCDPYELGEEELSTLYFYDEEADEKKTFGEQLEIDKTLEYAEFPRLFACTEY